MSRRGSTNCFHSYSGNQKVIKGARGGEAGRARSRLRDKGRTHAVGMEIVQHDTADDGLTLRVSTKGNDCVRVIL